MYLLSSRGRRSTALSLLALVLTWLGGLAHAEPGFATGDSHVAHAGIGPTSGIELGMPRDTDYALGIAYDARRRWRESYHAFAEAYEQFKRARGRRSWPRIVEGWMGKARFQMIQSGRMLAHRQKYSRSSPASRVYDRANIYHNKWLAIRAFQGRAPHDFRLQILRDYRLALSIRPGHQPSRIGLATFLHEVGRHADARREFALVVRPIPSWLAVEVAHYHVAAGKPLVALRKLHGVSADPTSRRHVLASNEFDLLRNHPAFRRLMGLR